MEVTVLEIATGVIGQESPILPPRPGTTQVTSTTAGPPRTAAFPEAAPSSVRCQYLLASLKSLSVVHEAC
eukprot:1144912-Pelagomonas_calceolata.AAC.9